ncbi:AAA family ATPase [Aquisediminimonas sediminicola]|uniref:AAA family ATPase n=1 Tax=Alteraquisediminimonas sediminicola TaxID=2676787 RepID=UPI001C8E87C4|nr:AAA family ATPase [Aquisediminimonas sediminicola]
MLDEPSDEIDRIAALRKTLAAKCGGDQSFGRATQIIRIPGSVHAKYGIASVCTIIEQCDNDYSLEDMSDIITDMSPMNSIEQAPQLMQLLPGGVMNFAPPPMMDFSPRTNTAVAAMNRDVAAGGDELTRWGEFSKVAGLKISEARRGNISPEQAYSDVCGWALVHMVPTWPQARIDQEYRRLLEKDAATHVIFPMVAQETDMNALPVEFFGDIQPSLLNSWLVRDFIPQHSLALFYGNPGSGKSFLALDIALRVAAGMEVDGRAVKQYPTVYLAAEGQGGFRRRVAAFRQHHKLDPNTPFALIPQAVNLLDPNTDLPRLVAAIEQASERLGGPPGLIIVDTLAATFGGGDENTSAMVGYLNNMAHLRDAFTSTVAVVHHRPKDQQNNTPRGHSSLMGAMDVMFCVEGGNVHSANITKQKDAEAGSPLCFALESINLGADEEGEPVNSAIVKYLAPKVEVNLSPQTLKVWKALRDAIAAGPGAGNGSLDPDPATLSITKLQWRSYWMLLGETDVKEDARSKAFNRAF